MRAGFANSPVVHHDNAVSVLHGGNALRNDDFRRAGDALGKRAADFGVRRGVNGGGGVVQDQHFRLFQYGPGDT